MPIPERKTQTEAFPNSHPNSRGWRRREEDSCHGCWSRWEPAGCAHQQLIHSAASPMLWSKTEATGEKKKKILFLPGFSSAHYSNLPTRRLLLNCIITPKNCWTVAFLLEGKTIFLQLTLMHSGFLPCTVLLGFFLANVYLAPRGPHLSVSHTHSHLHKIKIKTPMSKIFPSAEFCV